MNKPPINPLPSSIPNVLSVEQAQQKLLASLTPKKVNPGHDSPLLQAHNKICHSTVTANINIPPSDNSAMDGFAVNTADITGLPCSLKISDRITAGDSPGPLIKGTAARIFTGATIPQNANAVIIQENCNYDAQVVTVKTQPKHGDNIRLAGQDIALNTALISAGEKVSPAHIGILASAGHTSIRINHNVKVGLLSSGNELIEPGQPLPDGKIYNSNAAMLNALIDPLNAQVNLRVHVNDHLEQTCQQLSSLCEQCDLVISTGGVSVGEEDHVHTAIQTLGDIDFYKVAMKPGKPLIKGSVNNTPVLGLPGNPSSTLVTFLLFAVPLIKTLQGHLNPITVPYYVPANFTIEKERKRCEYIRVKRTANGLEAHQNQSSGALKAAAWADGLAQIDAHTTIQPGDLVPYFPYTDFFA